MQRLNIGCGNEIKQGYTNIDCRDVKGVDIVSDVHLLYFKQNSVDEIYCSDFLEHFKKEEAFKLLSKFHGWLKSGGTLDIRVPDLAAVAFEIIKKPLFEPMVMRIYGGQDYDTNYHYWGWTPESLLKFISPLQMTKIHEEHESWNMRFIFKK